MKTNDQQFTVEPRVSYERAEDMSSFGLLRVFIQDDGDVCVGMLGRDIFGKGVVADVEFCTIGSGGGRSPHTREALRDLAIAIQKDNAENPIE